MNTVIIQRSKKLVNAVMRFCHWGLQVRVFSRPPEGCRRIVVATNIAETSVTVDGIVYVIDTGRVKMKSFNPQTGIDALGVIPISRCGHKLHTILTLVTETQMVSECTEASLQPFLRRIQMLTPCMQAPVEPPTGRAASISW